LESDTDVPLKLLEKENLTKTIGAGQNFNMTFLYIKTMVEKLSNKYSDEMIIGFLKDIKNKERPEFVNDHLNDQLMELVDGFLESLTIG
jgi:hypothetical protein